MSLAATFIDADTLMVAADYTTYFDANRKVRADCGGDGYKYTVVTSATYSAPNTTVNLTADSDDLTSNLVSADWSVVKPGTSGNIPLHSHIDEDKGGYLPVIKPASDSTTAIQFQTAAATVVLNVDTTNQRVSIGTAATSSHKLSVVGNINIISGVTDVGFLGASNITNAQFSRNAYHDGASWQRADISKYAVLNQLFADETTGEFQIYTSVAATNPIGNWVKQFGVNSDGTGYFAGNVGVGIAASLLGKTHIDQSSTSAAIPSLVLDQADLSEEFIKFITTIGTGNPVEAIASKTLTTTHFIRVEIPGPAYVYIPVGTIA